MTERFASPVPYFLVLCVLLVLTVLTVAISFAPLAGAWHIALGLTIAAVKGALVVLFFMHAIHSPRVTWTVIGVSAAGLSIMLVLTFADYFSRGMVPGMAGH
jgi:cytochrome c oxidase subunit IV